MTDWSLGLVVAVVTAIIIGLGVVIYDQGSIDCMRQQVVRCVGHIK